MRCLPLSILFFVLVVTGLWGHGAEYTLLEDGLVGVQAVYQTGEFMSNARVLIFAPEETQIYLESRTDSRGIVAFSPHREGLWVLQILAEGGHGLRVNLEVDASLRIAAGRPSGFTAWQRIIMALCVVWGLVGTALFFSRRRNAPEPRTSEGR